MMRRSLSVVLSVTLPAIWFVAQPVAANESATTAAAADPGKGQEIAATVCASCHGLDGNSTGPQNPKLAGQHPEYLFKQMQEFKAVGDKPALRINATMNAMIAPYSEAQMRDLSAYFSGLKQSGESAKNRDTLLLGQKIFRAGDASKGLPACAGCHGPTGAGIPVQYPRIAGQYAEYLEAQLKAFRDGGRSNDPNKMMRLVALKMTDAEVKAVADYIAGLR